MKKKIAVIGAGLSGLALAQMLKDDADVVLFEKARGVGGRMSTRYADPFYFDHGAQCFTARTKAFQQFLRPYFERGIVAEWKGKVINFEIGKKVTKRLWFEPHLVASPNMNSLCKAMAEGLDIRLNTEVVPWYSQPSAPHLLHDKTGAMLGEFDWVISTAPPAQTTALFRAMLPAETSLHRSRMQGCYALMIGFNRPWDKAWMAAKVRNNPLKWISINSTKPGRNKNVTAIVAHSRNNWAEQHIDDDVQEAQDFLVKQFEEVTGISCADADYLSCHRWRYAIVEETQHAEFYLDNEHMLAATSDWGATSRIEEVWQNANKLTMALKLIL